MKIPLSVFEEAAVKLREIDSKPPNTQKYFFTGGTGIPDEMAIEFWKDTNVIVVDRSKQFWQYGKRLENVEVD